MNLIYYIKKVLSMPPQELAKKVLNKINTKVKDKLQKSRDLSKGTHVNFDVPIIENSYIDIKKLDTSNIDIKVANYLSKMYCEHRFDLLGSGWVKNSYDSLALGVEGYKYAMNIEAPRSIADHYTPIDWQKDYKSGYRWSEKTWYKNIKFGDKLGVDIKVPWELSRLQHLPQLAIFAMIDDDIKEHNIKEFRHQVVDFIANNPPRMGVNWVCTMDVGIRVANMLVAYDMFSQLDSFEILDDEFKQIFANSIYEHGIHIMNNLEYNEFVRNNHYLSDIAGLLFAAAYLESDETINKWLAFSIQEVISEMNYQFYDDGGNFESSTSYHRLSGELIVYSTALILGLKEDTIKQLQEYNPIGWKIKPRLLPLEVQQFKIINNKIDLPQWYIDRLYKIGRFTVEITKPNGEIPQIGDNDSGRFFRISPNGVFLTNKEAVTKYLNLENYTRDEELFWDENILNHSTFVSCCGGLFVDNIFINEIKFEKSIIHSISKQTLIPIIKLYEEIRKNNFKSEKLICQKKIVYNMKFQIKNFISVFFPNSGIFIFKNNCFYLAIALTPLGQKNYGGHTHNDKLSYELWIEGIDVIRDPGTYLYTPLPHRRNEFRSVMAHNAPIIGGKEQNDWNRGDLGLFHLNHCTASFVKDFGENFIELVLEYKGITVIRKFFIEKQVITIEDTSSGAITYGENKFFSNGYGKLMHENSIYF